jgi:hypothetical protein
MITNGQNLRINRLTDKALDAQDNLVELELRGFNPAVAKAKYFAALDTLGAEITAAVGIPYAMRLKKMTENSRYRRG